MRQPHPHPEIYCDLNAAMIDRGYSLERRGSVDDLARLGLTLADAVGMRFTFSKVTPMSMETQTTSCSTAS
jgi:hypothetical protein